MTSGFGADEPYGEFELQSIGFKSPRSRAEVFRETGLHLT